MKSLVLSLAALLVIGLTSCEKKGWGKKHCDAQDSNAVIQEYIYEPLITSPDCDCIVAGKVKYVGECGTLYLLDYGDGTCDDIAIKTICINGKCDGCKSYEETVKLDCTSRPEDGAPE